MKTIHWITIAVLVCGFVVFCILAFSSSDLKPEIEKLHGIMIPAPASNLQLRKTGMSWLKLEPYDGGVLSMFEMPGQELSNFLAQLTVRSALPPEKQGAGDPCVNGWNVWPTNSPTFVPGDRSLSGLTKTWQGAAKPAKMLSCKSNTGDWLHVEIWDVNDHILIKLYTDWN